VVHRGVQGRAPGGRLELQYRRFGERRAPHKPLLLLYALARLKHDRQTEIRFNATEAIVNPLLRSYGPWGSGAHVSYPYGRLVNDGLWLLPDRAQLVDATGNVRERLARERDAPAGFTRDVLATFERVPELIDVVALHLLERHFAPSLHEEILGAVGFELGTPLGRPRRDAAFRENAGWRYIGALAGPFYQAGCVVGRW
jgi:putative restriction endonuclease